MRFRNRVLTVRLRRGLSQHELMRQSGVSRLTIRRIEQDDGWPAEAGVQLKLCEILNHTRLFWTEREPGDLPPADEDEDEEV
jgi:transcriptional regulator with XRE-family HTH domain